MRFVEYLAEDGRKKYWSIYEAYYVIVYVYLIIVQLLQQTL
jgi:hypothetical protein